MSYYSDAVIRDGAVAYWRLGETSGNTAYDSVGSNHGTISGGVALNQAGPIADGNKAMAFDGTTGSVNASTVLIPVAFSIEVWIKKTGGSAFQTAVSNRSIVGGSILLGAYGANPLLYINGQIIGTYNLNDNLWHHLVATYNGTTGNVYVDGVLDVTGPLTRGAESGLVTIGKDREIDIGQHYWSGFIGEPAIYPLVLTPSQVKTHHTLGLLKQFPVGSYADNVIRDGAVAYWRLGETSGTTAVDIIGGNNGTISGGVTLGQSGALADGDKAMLFDGTSGRIETAATVLFPAACTVEFWLKTTLSGQAEIVSHRTAINTGFIVCGVYLTNLYIFATSGLQSTTRVVNDGIWHHAVIVLTGTSLSIYLDGVLDKTVGSYAHGSETERVNIAHDTHPDTVANWYAGSIDDVAIYNTALSAPQVANHHAVSKYATPFGESVGAGLVMNLVAGKIYSLPPRLVHITASAPIEVSVDGVTFTALTQEVTGASYIRTLEASCSLVAKPVRPIAIGA